MRPYDDPMPLKAPPQDLPDLEAEYREHLAKRPSNQDPKALVSWNAEKDRLEFWINLAKASAVPPVFVRTDLPAFPQPAISLENPMPQPKGRPLTEAHKQAIRDGKRKALQTPAEPRRGPAPPALPAAPPLALAASAELGKRLPLGQGLQLLMETVLVVFAKVLTMPEAEREALLLPVGNLDALTHQLAQFVATGRIEVPA